MNAHKAVKEHTGRKSGFWSVLLIGLRGDGGAVDILFEVERRAIAVHGYSDVAESWKPAHDLAMASYDFEELLEKGLIALGFVQTVHEAWQNEVLSGRQPPDLKADQAFWDLYAFWLRPCRRVKRELKFFEREGFEIKRAEEFLDAVDSLNDDRRGLSRPTTPLRPLSKEEADCIVSLSESSRSE